MTAVHTEAATSLGALAQAFLFLHILCAIGGFGGLVYRGLALEVARRRGDAATAGVLSVYSQISVVAEILVYGVLIFGIATVAASHNSSEYHKPWLVIAIVVYVLMIGLLHGLLRPAERRYREALLELAELPAVAPPARPPQLAELEALNGRIGLATGGLNVLLVVALYLMVFRP